MRIDIKTRAWNNTLVLSTNTKQFKLNVLLDVMSLVLSFMLLYSKSHMIELLQRDLESTT